MRVVDTVDVLEKVDLVAGLQVSAPNQICFQRLEKAFHGGTIIAIRFPAH